MEDPLVEIENQTLEWKEQWNDNCLKTICAFANSEGGTLIIGKNDKGETVGVKKAEDLLKVIPNQINNFLGLSPQIDEEHVGKGKFLIRITVKPSREPITYKSTFYERVGATNQAAKGQRVHDLRRTGISWDAIAEHDMPISALSGEALYNFRERSRRPYIFEISDEQILENLKLFRDGALTRAAILLFHPQPQRFFPNACVRVGKFDEKGLLVTDNTLYGPLLLMPDKVMELVYSKYFTKVISYKGMYRQETFPVPEEAFREAITNAVIHRTYSSYDEISIYIRPEETVIENSGTLPDGWSIDRLYEAHESRCRNPLLASTFDEARFVEKWGQGVKKILTECEKAGLPRPEYEAFADRISIKFRTLSSADKVSAAVAGNNLIRSSRPQVAGNEIFQRWLRVLENDTQREIVKLIQVDDRVTLFQMAERIGVHSTTISAEIRKLKAAGILKRHGTKNGFWEIANPL